MLQCNSSLCQLERVSNMQKPLLLIELPSAVWVQRSDSTKTKQQKKGGRWGGDRSQGFSQSGTQLISQHKVRPRWELPWLICHIPRLGRVCSWLSAVLVGLQPFWVVKITFALLKVPQDSLFLFQQMEHSYIYLLMVISSWWWAAAKSKCDVACSIAGE